jgi:uncharacterized membrane protein (Fun14 family)
LQFKDECNVAVFIALTPPCSIPETDNPVYAASLVESLMIHSVTEFACVCGLDSSSWATLLATQVGFGGSFGFLLGYGLKKVATILLKIAALIAGLFMLALTWLASIGVITINFNAFTSTIENNLAGAISALLASLAWAAQVLPMGGSFGLGFYLGAKKG